MADTVLYVTIRDDGWAVMRQNAQRATKVHATQAEAISHAKELLGDEGGGRLMIQNREGGFRDGVRVSAKGKR